MKRLLSFILVVMLSTAAIFANGASESGVDTSLTDVQEKGTFILGLDDSFPPMGFRAENGDIVGFDIDTAKEVAKRLGVELVSQPIDWNSKEQELATGNIDCIWNGFTVTPEREDFLRAIPQKCSGCCRTCRQSVSDTGRSRRHDNRRTGWIFSPGGNRRHGRLQGLH